jgi:hypothetical protein
LSVPETLSSFRRDGWWKRRDHWSYLIAESLKLAGYGIRYGLTKRTSTG